LPTQTAPEEPPSLNNVSFARPLTARFRPSPQFLSAEIRRRSVYGLSSASHASNISDADHMPDHMTEVYTIRTSSPEPFIDLNSEINRSRHAWETYDYGAFRGIFTEPTVPIHTSSSSVYNFLDPALPHEEELLHHRVAHSVNVKEFKSTLYKVALQDGKEDVKSKDSVGRPYVAKSPYRRRPPQKSSEHQPKCLHRQGQTI
jgi:hypothetical protein